MRAFKSRCPRAIWIATRCRRFRPGCAEQEDRSPWHGGAELRHDHGQSPAVISYCWDGRNSEHTLHVEEAARIIVDEKMPEAMRTSAGIRIFMIATKAMRALNDAQTFEGIVGSDAILSIKKLKKQLGCKE